MSAADDDVLLRIAEVCEAAAGGDLEARLLDVPADGPLRRAALAINHLLDVSDAYVRESTAAMDHASHGRFHRPILTRGLPGAYVQAAATINGAAAKLRDDAAAIERFNAERARTVAELGDATAAVAASCEQLSVTTAGIKEQVARSVSMSRGAVGDSDRSSEALRTLDEAGRRIHAVVTLIARIASQTNLLALNATIEAARAGDRGAGFAVVANEVKVLSRDTARATDEITETVNAMRDASEQAARAVQAIADGVRSINEQARDVFGLLDEQAKATSDIAMRITAVAGRASNLTRAA